MEGGRVVVKEHNILFKENKAYTYKSVNGEISYGIYSTDSEEAIFEEFGSNSEINDICESNDGNYIVVGTFDVADFDTTQTSKTCPGIIKFSPTGEMIFNSILEGRGRFISIRYKENGYYGIVDFYENNVKDYNNESAGCYIVRYDSDFNVIDCHLLEETGANLFDLDEHGISVLDKWGMLYHFNTEYDYSIDVANPENGGKITLQEDREYYPNEEVSFNVQEDEGYKLKEIQIVDKDGNQVELLDDNKFIMPSSEVTITPIFKKLNNKIIVVSKDETEDVKFEIADITEVEDGTLVKMYITAVLGYEIENLEIVDADKNQIDYTETDTNEYTFIMPDSDVTITPNYKPITKNEENKENEKPTTITEKIKTEVKSLYDKAINPTTGDRTFEFAFAGVAGIIVLLIVKSKRRKHSTRKSNILY